MNSPPERCSIPGCDRPRYGRGWCQMHYGRWRKSGDPAAEVTIGRPAQHDTCTIDGCEQPHKSRGLCAKHYGRWRHQGDPLAEVRPYRPGPPDGLCTVEGCGGRHQAKGLCELHYRRAQRATIAPTARSEESRPSPG